MAEDIQKKDWHNETRMLSELIPYEKNPRKITKEDQKRLKKSFKNTGYAEVIAIDKDNVIVAGHQRYEILKQLNKKDIEIDVRVPPEKLTKKEFDDYLIASNKDTGEWDHDKLAEEFTIEELLEKGFDEADFDDVEIEQVDTEGDDETPETQEEPKTVKGDLYELGDHRLLCGDATVITDVEKLMDGKKADILFSDPPYGINFKPQRKTHDEILNDNLNDADFALFLNEFLSCSLLSMKPDTYAFIWTGWFKIGIFAKALEKVFKIQAMHVWVKNNFGIGYYSRPKHEPFYLCLNGKPKYPKVAPADVWEAQKVTKTIHSCEKPVCLIIDILDTYHKNSLVLDPFGGSGSTLIACEKTHRKCFMMELDTKYCDVIVKRYKTFCEKNDKVAVIKRNGEVCSDF